MISCIIVAFCFVESGRGSDVYFAAYNRLHTFFFAGVIKIDNAVHCAVIRYGDGVLTVCRRGFRNIRYSARSVEKAVFGVKM